MTEEVNGDCFPTAYRLVLANPEYVLCHGIVTGPAGSPGERPHWHAWVERTDTYEHPEWPTPVKLEIAIDQSNGNDQALPTALYYKLGQVERVNKYTYDEAILCATQEQHYGPWEQYDE